MNNLNNTARQIMRQFMFILIGLIASALLMLTTSVKASPTDDTAKINRHVLSLNELATKRLTNPLFYNQQTAITAIKST